MKWPLISMGEIALRKGGSVNPKKHPGETFQLYSIPAFDDGAPEVVAGSAIGSTKKAVEPNDVMISRIVPHIRRAWVVGPSQGHRQIASSEWIIFRDERIWPSYLRWVLVGDVFHSAFMRTVSGVGGSLLRARPAEVFKIQVPLAPLPEQKRIAAILDAADALRAKRREALAQFDTLIQSVFLDMFGDLLTNPMRWPERTLGELGQGRFRNGLSPSSKGTVNGEVLTLSAITRGRFDFAAKKSVLFDHEPPPSQRVSTDVFLICRGNGNKTLVGAGAYPDRTSDSVCFPDTMIGVTIGRSSLASAYLQSAWRTRRVRRQIERGARTTNGTHKINQRLLSAITLPVPPLEIQLRFAAIAASIKEQESHQRAHLAELDTLFASLQSRAFRGDL